MGTKKDVKVVEMPKAETQKSDNKPTYENLMQIANQLAQQNDIYKKRVAVLESELNKFASDYQRIVFLQELLRIDASYIVVEKKLFKTQASNCSPFDEEVIDKYSQELIDLLERNKNIKTDIEQILKDSKDGKQQSKPEGEKAD